MSPRRPRVLVELRPALEGHAGIPEATRLLFRSLRSLKQVEVAGLIQSPSHVLGAPPRASENFDNAYLDRPRPASYLTLVTLALHRLLGRAEALHHLEPALAGDYVWERLFARSLSAEDFAAVSSAAFWICRAPRAVMHAFGLLGMPWRRRSYPRLDTSQFDALIVQMPFPAEVSRQTRLIVRYHDSIALLQPETTRGRESQRASTYSALRSNVEAGAWFACVSDFTRAGLISMFPDLDRRAVTIPNEVSDFYVDRPSSCEDAEQIVSVHCTSSSPPLGAHSDRRPTFGTPQKGGTFDYLLVVSTFEPRKNHLGAIDAWERLRSEALPALKLVLVGSTGWRQDETFERLRPSVAAGDAFVLSGLPASQLRVLYKNAVATVCPSFSEGFDLPGAEALASGGLVVASDIAAHREVYGDAARYFDPDSPRDLERAILEVVGTSNRQRRMSLLSRGREVAGRYRPSSTTPMWQAFLSTLLAE